MEKNDIKLRLEEVIKKLSNSEQASQHLGKAAKYAGKGLSQWANDNPKIATALAAGAAGLAMGKRMSRRT